MSFTDKGLDIANQHIHYAEYVLIQRPKLLAANELTPKLRMYHIFAKTGFPSLPSGEMGSRQRIVADRRQRDVEDCVRNDPKTALKSLNPRH